MKKFYLLLAMCFAVFAANAWTVKFTNPNNWESVSVYTFNPETCGVWPGSKMTKSGDVWEYTGDGNPTKIIFNDTDGSHNPKQTDNLDFVDGATYNFYGPVGAQLNTYTVYFDNTANWPSVYVYVFNPESAGTWPGTQLQKNANGLYQWDYQATSTPSFEGIIFTAGQDSPQTENLTYEVGATYNANGLATGDNPGGGGGGGNYGDWWVNIGGPFNGNDFYNGGVQPVNNIATFTDVAIGTLGFKIKTWDGENDVYYIADGISEVPTNEWVQYVVDGYDTSNTVAGATESSVYTVQYNVETNQIYISTDGGAVVDPNPDPIDPTPNPSATAIYVVGAGEGLGWDLPGKEITVGDDGNFTFSISNLSKFKFSTVNTTVWDDFNAAAYATGDVTFNEKVSEQGGQTLPLVSWGDDQMLPWTGDYTIIIKGDFTAMTAMTSTPQTTPDVYLRGEMNGWGADPDWMFEYMPAEDVYALRCKIAANQTFKIADADWGTVNYGYSVGAVTPSEFDQEIYLDFGGQDNNLYITADFDGVINFKLLGNNQAYVIISGQTDGVNAIEATEENAVYFNLQGVKVTNPEKGQLLIKVANGKATKVVK